jgi:hypothetical protein
MVGTLSRADDCPVEVHRRKNETEHTEISALRKIFKRGQRKPLGRTKGYARSYKALSVQVFNIQCVVLNEGTTRLYDIPHQLGKDIISFRKIIDFDLQQRARLRV